MIRSFAQNKTTLPCYYNAVAMSADGRHQTLVQRAESDDTTCPSQAVLLVSCDHGKTFASRLTILNFTGVAMSSCGQYQTAVVQANNTDPMSGPGYIYTSHDFGETWSQNTNAPSNGWYGVAMSATGQYQLALPNTYKSAPLNGFLFCSSDFGKTWTPREGPGEQLWLTGSMNASGSVQVASVFGTLADDLSTASPGAIYMSRDYGCTWARVPALTDYFNCIAISKCGQHITAGAQNCFFAPAIPSALYVSSDGGINWLIVNAATDNWLNVAMTSTGKYQCALSYQQEPDSVASGYVYQSCDFGQTWHRNETLPQNHWTSNALSADGKYHTLVATLCGNVFQQDSCTMPGALNNQRYRCIQALTPRE